MIPPFLMLRPATVEEALGFADEHGEAARYYAGGTELLLVMREGFLDADVLIDLKRIDALSGISVDEEDATLRIGAASTHSDIERAPMVQSWMPELARLSGSLANLRVRNTGTLGGNLSFAEPHGDPATLLMAADGRVILRTQEGSRMVDVEDFIVGAFEVDLAQSELMTEIRIPLPAPGSRFGYSRFRALERPSIGVAIRLDLPAGSDAVTDARVVVGCAGPRPQRIPEAERLLKEAPRSTLAEVARTAGEAVSEVVDVDGDAYGPEDYKRSLAGVLVRRTILAALSSPAAHTRRGGDA